MIKLVYNLHNCMIVGINWEKMYYSYVTINVTYIKHEIDLNIKLFLLVTKKVKIIKIDHNIYKKQSPKKCIQ